MAKKSVVRLLAQPCGSCGCGLYKRHRTLRSAFFEANGISREFLSASWQSKKVDLPAFHMKKIFGLAKVDSSAIVSLQV